jgi:serine/threonine-protein kinase
MPDHAAKPPGETSRIGGFELLATLGKGGMGTVFKARQVSMDRVVALKVLPPHLAKNQDFVQRFLREARSAAQLNHPNIVQGIDVGEADGVYYFAMEFVDGLTARDLLKREGRLDEKRALSIIGGVARALEHAHKHGIVHRDIKPDNIMISREGVVKLADLGLAKSFLPEASRLREGKPGDTGYQDTVTLDGTALGTPHYMAPEQARGDADIDTRADIYALGATLYHMVTGEFPFSAPTPAAIMAKHITQPAPNPKEKNPALSRPVCDLIQFMMAKEREARPQTPTELLAEVRDALEGKVKLRRLHAAPTRAMPSSPLPPGEGRVRAAGTKPSHRVIHAPAKKGMGVLPWIGVALLAAAVVGLIVVLKPGRADNPPKVSDPRKVEPKDSEKAEATPPTPLPKSQPDEEFHGGLAALRTACLAAAGKDQFGKAIEQIDAFTKKFASDAASGEAAKLRDQVLTRADARYTELLLAVNDALTQKDYGKARAALKPAESFGVEAITAEAQKKLAEIGSREKSAAEWAKWDEIKASVKKLTDAGQPDDAAKALEPAKALKLDNIAELVQEQTDAIADARQKAADAVVAAYAKESDKVWTLFKDRKYAEAEKLLADLASSLPKVSHLREGIARPLSADQGAAKLLKEFWAAVEKGLAAKAGQFVSFKGAAGGTLVAVQDGTATVKTAKGNEPRRVQDLVAKQAIAHADLKDDPPSNLLKGVFLLAEGQDLGTAEKHLAAAGDAPGLAFYKDRLDRAMGREKAVAEAKDAQGREAAARTAWRALLAASKGDLTQTQAKRVLASLETFEAKYGDTRFAESAREELAALRPRIEDRAEGEAPKPAVEPTGDELEQGLLAVYYTGRNMDKFVAAKPMSGALSFNWGPGAPLPEMPTDDFSIRFVGWLKIDAGGMYTFKFWRDDGARLYLDGGKAIDEWGSTPATQGNTPHTVFLTKGLHRVWVEYFEGLGMAAVALQWQEGGKLTVVPPDRFFCERKLLDSVRAAPKRNPLLRMRPTDRVRPPEPKPVAELPVGKWQDLFDGKTLAGWRIAEGGGPYAEHGDVEASPGQLVLGAGKSFTGIACTAAFPTEDYEVAYEAKRLAGGDCFGCALFPVGTSQVCFVLGGWGGAVVGLDCVDGQEALGNATTRRMEFVSDRWYSVRVRVTKARIQTWLDQEKVVDLARAGHTFSIAGHHWPLKPFGLQTTYTKGAFRNIRVRRLDLKDLELPKKTLEPATGDLKVGKWHSLFDGKTLAGWEPVTLGEFAKAGRIHAENGEIVLDASTHVTGLVSTRDIVNMDYELTIEAMRDAPGDLFYQVVFPVGDSFCTLIVGGWGGGLVCLEAVDGRPSDQSVTARRMDLQPGKWHRANLRVTQESIEVRVDNEKVISLPMEGHSFTMSGRWLMIKPFGIVTGSPRTVLRDIALRRLGSHASEGIEKKADAGAEALKAGKWDKLFDGKSLNGWRSVSFLIGNEHWEGTGDGAEPRVEKGVIVLDSGRFMRGITWQREAPKGEYEVALEARRTEGDGCFCLLLFPIGDSLCALGVGGWGGLAIGLDSVDGHAGHDNPTSRVLALKNNQWYRIRLLVLADRVQGWLDDRKVFDLPREGHSFGAHGAFNPLRPFGVASARSTVAIRSFSVRALTRAADGGEAKKP